jgi:hypothetical protein
MKKLYKPILVLFCCIEILSSNAQPPTFDSNNVNQLLGEWKGTLTYLDYTSKKLYTMPAVLKISQIPNSYQLVFSNIYPNEPKANNADTISLINEGKMLDKEVVKTKSLLSNGDTEIVTEYNGIDGNDNKPALIRHIYTFGKTIYIKRKEIQYKGDSEWVLRHEYNYHRK